MYLLDGTTGAYFIRGEYVAMRAGDGGPWRVSKVEHDPADTKRATLTVIGEWWTAEDATASIDWHTRRDQEDAASEEATDINPWPVAPGHTGHPPTWPGYIDQR